MFLTVPATFLYQRQAKRWRRLFLSFISSDMKIRYTGSIYTAWAVSVVPFWESLWPYLDDDDNNDRLGGNGLLVYVGDDLRIAVAVRHYGMGLQRWTVQDLR